jgi:hypothetical protein
MLASLGVERLDGRTGGITRRHALAAGALAAAAALVPGARIPAAWAAPRLQPRRAATYRRLVAVLRGAPDGRFSGRRPAAATRAFARWYAAQDDAARAHADAALDALGSRPLASYGELARTARRDGDPAVAAAVALAALACEPPPDEDERPVTPALWVPT